MPERGHYVPEGRDRLHSVAAKLSAIADLVGMAQDLGAVRSEGLALLLADLAAEVDQATDELAAD